jgi:DNA invertase Pin-like site-specific DNA recombinase
MRKAFGYCRVSHEDSTESGLGIDAQKFAIAQWWQYQRTLAPFQDVEWGTVGWEGEKDVGATNSSGLFVDQSVSAFKHRLVKRPAGSRLAATLTPGDVVVFARLDRAFRNLADFAVQTERWIRQGVNCVFISPSVDMTTAYGQAFAQIAAVFAQLESAIKSERLKEAQARGRERGQKMGRHTSFGWKQDGWTTRTVNGTAKKVPVMVPDNQEREEVRVIVDLHDNLGLSFADIADRLEATRAFRENREPWPRAPYKGSENRKWNASRVFKAYKARTRVPLPQCPESV